VVLLILSQRKFSSRKKTDVKIDIAASTGSHGKLTYFISFTWFSLEAGTVDLKVLFFIYACQEACVSYLHSVCDPLIFVRICPV
jgi:hypothetical protein